MGRPLKKETIEKMNLTVTTKEGNAVLGKQVGYNKYIVDVDAHKIVRLAKEVIADDDAVLTLQVNGEDKPVLKVLKNLVQTEEGVYAYQLVDDAVVFADANVAFKAPVAPKTTRAKKPAQPEVTEPVVEEPTTEPETTDEE